MIVIAGGGSTFASNLASIVAEACRRLKPRSKLLNIWNMPVELFIVWQLWRKVSMLLKYEQKRE